MIQKTKESNKSKLNLVNKSKALKSQHTLNDETFIPGFDKPRDCLDSKYIDAEYWPIVAAVRIYYDSDLRVVHLGAKYRFIHPDYPEDLISEFEG